MSDMISIDGTFERDGVTIGRLLGYEWHKCLDIAHKHLTDVEDVKIASTIISSFKRHWDEGSEVIKILHGPGVRKSNFLRDDKVDDLIQVLNDKGFIKAVHGFKFRRRKKVSAEVSGALRLISEPVAPVEEKIIEATPAVIEAPVVLEAPIAPEPPAESEKDRTARLLLGLKANNSELAKLRGEFEALLKEHQSLQQLFVSYKAESSARIARLEHERKAIQTPHPRRRLFASL